MRCKDGYPTMTLYIKGNEYNTYDTQGAPRTNSKWKAHTKFLSQAGKGCLVKWLCENIS